MEQELYKLAESCNYGDMKDEMIRDRLVVEIRDNALSKRLQLDTQRSLWTKPKRWYVNRGRGRTATTAQRNSEANQAYRPASTTKKIPKTMEGQKAKLLMQASLANAVGEPTHL